MQTKRLYYLLISFSLLILLSQPFLLAVGQNTAKPIPYVVMISIDGLVPNYYTKADRYGLKIPNIRALCREGSFAHGSETVYPSLTYPAHTTLVTGVSPARHGVVSNVIWQDPLLPRKDEWYWYANAIKSPTLWSEAGKIGLKTAAIGWPVTAGAPIDYNFPEIWQAGDFDNNFKVVSTHTTAGLMEKFLAILPQPASENFSDELRTQAAEFIISNYKPQLLLLHLTELDSAQHHSAPFSSEAFAQLEAVDQMLGRIFNVYQKIGIAAQTTYVVVSDHGFMSVSKQFNPNFILMKKGLLTFNKEGAVKEWQAIAQGSGGSLAIMGNNLDKAKKEQLIELFEVMAKQPNSPIYRVVKSPELAKLGANPQAICFLEAASGYTMSDKFLGEAISKPNNKGVHGYLPTRAEMYASLIMAGQGIRQGVNIPLTRNHNVAPTIGVLLGFSLAETEGRPLREFLTLAPVLTPKPQEKAK